MSNYPDSVSPADPDAPWNQSAEPAETTEPRWFIFDSALDSLSVKARSKEEAVQRLEALLETHKNHDVEFLYDIDEIKALQK